MKICLDPGHYGKYNSGIIKGYYESEMNLKLAYKLKEKLEKYGAKVFLTRTGTEDLSLIPAGRWQLKMTVTCFSPYIPTPGAGMNPPRGSGVLLHIPA